MNNYESQRAWSDRFIDPIRRLVGQHLLVVTPNMVDMQQAADLMVFTARSLTIAARVRRHEFLARYPTQFTVRSDVPFGYRTEHEKLLDGWGDWMFYGFADPTETAIAAWMLLDLNAWRAAVCRHGYGKISLECGYKKNHDGTSFRWYDVRSFPRNPRLIIAHDGISILQQAAA
jgi:hypothetical protein